MSDLDETAQTPNGLCKPSLYSIRQEIWSYVLGKSRARALWGLTDSDVNSIAPPLLPLIPSSLDPYTDFAVACWDTIS